MNTKQFEPSFQMIANSLSEINITNTIVTISDYEEVNREFSIGIKDLSIESHDTYKTAGLDVEVNVLIEKNETGEQKKFEARIVISGIFTDNKDVSDEEFSSKLKINGVAALYSIARGFITNVSSQALVNGKIVLPLVNFLEAAKTISSD